MAGFAMVCNHALRDNALSLAAKGLYMVISSFAGMPGWSLTKRALAQYSESQYALEKAWHELQQAGLLKHRCFRKIRLEHLPMSMIYWKGRTKRRPIST